MSQESVELVAASLDAYNAGEMDSAMRFYTPDVEVLPDASVFPEAGPLHGREEFRDWLKESGTAWVSPRWVTAEIFATDDGHVVCRGDWGGKGVASGIDMASGITGVHTIRDGRISRIEYFFDHDQALKAVGLAE